MTEPSTAELLERVENTLRRGSYDPYAAEWRACFDSISRDEALVALTALHERLKAAEREAEAATFPSETVFAWKERVEAAEQRLRELEGLLQELWDYTGRDQYYAGDLGDRVRAALSEEHP